MQGALPDTEFQNGNWLVDIVSKAPEQVLVTFLPTERKFVINVSELGKPPDVMTSTLADWLRTAACHKAREIMNGRA